MKSSTYNVVFLIATLTTLVAFNSVLAIDDEIAEHPDHRIVAYYTKHSEKVSELRSVILNCKDNALRFDAFQNLAKDFPIATEITARELVTDKNDQIAASAISTLKGTLVMSDHSRSHQVAASPQVIHMLEKHRLSRDALRVAIRDQRSHIRMDAATFLASQSDIPTLKFIAQEQIGLYADVEAANIITLSTNPLAQELLSHFLNSDDIDTQRTAIGYLGALTSYHTLIRNRFLLNPDAAEILRLDAARTLSIYDPDFAAYALVVTSDPNVSPSLQITTLTGYVDARSKTTNLDSSSARVFETQLAALNDKEISLSEPVQQDLDRLLQRLATVRAN